MKNKKYVKLKDIYASPANVYKNNITSFKIQYTVDDAVKEYYPFSDDILKWFMRNIYRKRRIYKYDVDEDNWKMLDEYVHTYLEANLDDLKKFLSAYYSDYNILDNYNGVIHQVTSYGELIVDMEQIEDAESIHELLESEKVTTERLNDEERHFDYNASGEIEKSQVSAFNTPNDVKDENVVTNLGGHVEKTHGGKVEVETSGGKTKDTNSLGKTENKTLAHTDTFDETKRGNLGVTTSAQMLAAEEKMRLESFFKFRFVKRFFDEIAFDM